MILKTDSVRAIYRKGLNSIQDERRPKMLPPTSFDPVTSENVGISPQDFYV